MDVARIRADFPLLRRQSHGHPIAYLDSAATSQKPQSVLDAESRFYAESNANVHRGVYELAEAATAAYEGARERVARFVSASDPSEIVFLRGTTEAINLLAYCLSESRLRKGDRILTTVLEHHSNIVPWQIVGQRRGLPIDFLDIDAEGRLRLDELRSNWKEGTRVLSVAQISNVLGTVNPVREIAEIAHEHGALVVVDAAQAAPHQRIDVRALGADFVAFSGHKMLGPTGIGALWGRSELLQALPPFLGGGEMIRAVHTDRVTFADPPTRFEAGTPNFAGAVGLGAAIEYLSAIGWDELRAHGRMLADRAVRGARDRFGDDLRFYGPVGAPDHEAILSYSFAGAHPHDVASLLDAEGIAVRAGHHCAQPLMTRLKVSALTRLSPYLYNTPEEIDRWVEGMARVRTVFGPPPTERPLAQSRA